jgi:hypothetical protein
VRGSGTQQMVKQLLKELGVVFLSSGKKENVSDIRSKLANVSVWSDKDLQAFDDSKLFARVHRDGKQQTKSIIKYN